MFRAGVISLALAFTFGLGVMVYGAFFPGSESPETAGAPDSEPTFEPLEIRSEEPVTALEEPTPTGDDEPATVTLPGDPDPRPESRPEPAASPEPEDAEQPEPTTASAAQSPLPGEPQNWPAANPDEIAEANGVRDFGAIPQGAVLGLTIDAIGIENAPVWPDDSPAYLDRGVTHAPETSLPWTNTPERNTYLAAHRIGYPSTGSRLLFYNLDRLEEGDEIVVARRTGKKFTYRVTEKFVVEPSDSWVMGRVRGRDMVTLQTCTPIPTFEDRLIIRADRVR